MTPEDRISACIALKVPNSGDDELDALIREARLMDFLQNAAVGTASKVKTPDGAPFLCDEFLHREMTLKAYEFVWQILGGKP